ncbi:transcriptional regulator of NAD metabolism [Breznakia sp. PF5-3]|uniref:transcription repressor NadR n=1 Tax=unclassified Breznakia TaxID=2623764 RepID=UPI0024071FAC|nr:MULTISPECIES: transcription repressor NadR [unclassified Breznakia]MDF9824267.1 transcriptional regulator of NAD metabolism [Breznakia sp. PM6-1]MDF9835491.1 transcriptional regulator of NAD metabolism [Breznakia sp. PF5-3]MDF9838035.1 transcriptional regulator of NAD metabolism [Breznakia sp. PFB2-8]MDF9859413.1 transcriptional regulator of NAD metabolism [Breznakia sp. PH5-24]
MDTKVRRIKILEDLKQTTKPLNATLLAKKYGVSRQIVVGDIAILKAQQEPIVASVKGYLYLRDEDDGMYTIACKHSSEETREELQIIVDNGGVVMDVIVDHPVYGELVGNLDIASRYDIDQFMDKIASTKAKNLSEMNEGIHLHTIKCHDQATYERIKKQLREGGYLYE